MKDRQSKYNWIPLWVDKWLFGSTRIELKPDERSVWVDLIALASKDEGHIRANETTPYLDEQLAGLLFIPLELLQRTIDKCIDAKINKLGRTALGTLYVINWDTYRLSERHQRRFMSTNEDTMSSETVNVNNFADTIIKEDKNILKEKKKKDKEKRHQIPPTIEDVISYCEERKNHVNAKTFMNHYESNGWKVGKNKMVDWQATVRKWEADAAHKKKDEYL